MAPPAAKKRTLGVKLDGLKGMFDKYSAVQPEDYADAFQALLAEMREVIEQADQSESPPSLAATSLSLGEAQDLFNLLPTKSVFWRDVEGQKIPAYILENIRRKSVITNWTHQGTEALSRFVIHELVSSAVYEETHGKHEQSASLAPLSPTRSILRSGEQPALLQLQHETKMQKRVMYEGKERLLSGFADCSVWYDAPGKSNLATNLIIIEAKKPGHTDSCIPRLTALMGTVHASRKEEGKTNAVVHGVASDGLAFRFCRIDDNGEWSQSPLWEWEAGDEQKIYSTFRNLIRIAALSSPSKSPIKDPEKRQIVLAKFQTPSQENQYDFNLPSDLSSDEESESDYIDWPPTRLSCKEG